MRAMGAHVCACPMLLETARFRVACTPRTPLLHLPGRVLSDEQLAGMIGPQGQPCGHDTPALSHAAPLVHQLLCTLLPPMLHLAAELGAAAWPAGPGLTAAATAPPHSAHSTSPGAGAPPTSTPAAAKAAEAQSALTLSLLGSRLARDMLTGEAGAAAMPSCAVEPGHPPHPLHAIKCCRRAHFVAYGAGAVPRGGAAAAEACLPHAFKPSG